MHYVDFTNCSGYETWKSNKAIDRELECTVPFSGAQFYQYGYNFSFFSPSVIHFGNNSNRSIKWIVSVIDYTTVRVRLFAFKDTEILDMTGYILVINQYYYGKIVYYRS